MFTVRIYGKWAMFENRLMIGEQSRLTGTMVRVIARLNPNQLPPLLMHVWK